MIAGAILLAVALLGWLFWSRSRDTLTTDDAFIESDTVIVPARTDGEVRSLAVTDNSLAARGTRLLQLDTQNLGLALDAAQAEQDRAAAQRDALPDAAPSSQRRAADAALREARAHVAMARLALGRATIVAPITGYVAKRSVAVGDVVAAGQPLLAIVSPDVWVTANFKETQIGRLKIGQPARITIDAYPALTLTGRIDSLQHASGQAFSLLPPENASGNFVKVVQRVPVKIRLDSTPKDGVFGPGMSVHVRVDVR
jgi:membrane fusion protein (multidrug efflux system)